MVKAVYCKDAGFSDCAAVMRGDTEDEVIQKAAEHGKSVHNLELTPELTQQVKTLIKEE